MTEHDPVFYNDHMLENMLEEPQGWYFMDETWTGYYGPFPSEEVARKRLGEYVILLNGEEAPNSQAEDVK